MDLYGILRPMTRSTRSFDAEYCGLLRATGFMAWLFTYILFLTAKFHGQLLNNRTAELAWMAAWLLFPCALWCSTSERKFFVDVRLYVLGLQVVLSFLMRIEQPNVSINRLLLVVTWEVVFYFSLKQVVWWLTIQLGLYAIIDIHQRSLSWLTLSSLVVYFFFKIFTCGLISAAKREGAARMRQTQIIADLRARQQYLSESVRMSERLRISRDLHDALGHGLTALALHLEVALNNSHPADVAKHVRKSQMVARGLLTEVRDVVGSIRAKGLSESIDLSPVLTEVLSDIPGLHVHFSRPDSMSFSNPDHAHALIRCVQEISTNTLKHAEAENLWLTLTVKDDIVQIEAIDDGKGVQGKMNHGSGLTGMQERFRALGGSVTVSSDSPRGFCVMASLPIQSLQESL